MSGTDRLGPIGLMLGSVVMFSFMDTIAKYLIADYPTGQVIWARYTGHMLLLLVLFGPVRFANNMKTTRPGVQIARGMLLVGATLGNFLALRYLQLTETISIFFTGPMFVAILSILILGERVGPRRWAAIFCGFAGALIVTRPGLGGLHWSVVFAFGSAISYALYAIFTRMLAGIDSAETSLIYTAIVGMVVTTPFAFAGATWPKETLDWVLFPAMGLVGAVGHYLLILAHNRAPASVLSPFSYTAIIWMTVWGFLVFDDIPRWTTALGAAIVIGSSLYMLIRERKVKGDAVAEAAEAPVRGRH